MTAYRTSPQARMWLDELIVDNFAGGGGASTGIENAIGRPVDIAINHDGDAIAMHTINHPATKHYCESVWDVSPRKICNGQPVGVAWFSPDCKHFSKAKGGTPVNKEIRGLAWVAVRWAATVKPRIIVLENVEEFTTWGPVVDGKPCPKRKGKTFASFKRQLQKLGYQVEHKLLRACDYGAPTTRQRLFLIARRDAQPIVWPAPTHGDPTAPGFKKSGLKKWKTAADIIDWSLPCPSIFERKRPLSENTMRRIARGIQRFVLDNPKPFIAKVNHGYDYFRGQKLNEPLQTVTAINGYALVAPVIERQFGGSAGNNAANPLATITAGGGGKCALVAAFMAKHYGGNYNGPGASLEQPAPTVTTVDHNALVTSHMVKLRGTNTGSKADAPVPTITASGTHIGEVRAFLLKYYGTNIGHQANEPLQTVTTKHRFGLVTVQGEQYQIVDIGMRMLEPHELFAAQGFPSDYVINIDAAGNPIPKYKQVARCGNSVCPPIAEAIVKANYQNASAQEVRNSA